MLSLSGVVVVVENTVKPVEEVTSIVTWPMFSLIIKASV